jgi:hypothetical protein
MKTRRMPARFHLTALLSTEAEKRNNPQISQITQISESLMAS